MMTFQSVMISAATLLLVGCSLASSAMFMANNKPYDDKFYEMFTERAPVNEIIKLALNWNADKQLDHFDQLYHHIDAKDDSAEYAQEIVDAARAELKRALENVGYEKDMTLEEYLFSTFLVQNHKKQEVSPDVLSGLELLDKVNDDPLEKLLNQGSEEELKWELNHLYPYKEVPYDSTKTLKVQEGPENESTSGAEQFEESDAGKTSTQDHPAEQQESQDQNLDSEDQVEPPQEFEDADEEVEESTEKPSQGFEEADEEVEESTEQPSQESEELVNEPEEPQKESEDQVQEPEESIEEVISEPKESESLDSSPQES